MRSKKEFAEHILMLMKEKGLTKSALGEALGATGISQVKVQRANGFLTDKNHKLDMSDLIVAARFLEVDPKDLLLKSRVWTEVDEKRLGPKINENHLVPLMSNVDAELVRGWLVYPYDNSAHKKIIAIAMPNDSQKPEIHKGEIIFVDSRLYGFSLENRLVLATYDGEFIVGRFERLEKGQIRLTFLNPNYPPLIYSIDNEKLEIVGIVISRFAEVQ